jgi:hypothetical protein
VEVQSTIFPVQQGVGETCIMPVSYLPPIQFYQIMLKYKSVIFDIHEHFHKQYYFNRCEIYGANGKLKLSVPIIKNHKRTPLKDASVFYEENWRIIHWRSLQAAYRRSPFFEFYEDALAPIYLEYKPQRLIDWNLKLFEVINKLLGVTINYSFTESYQKIYENSTDYRGLNLRKSSNIPALIEVKYQQVFQEKYGFISNLSIIDILFCEGRHAGQMLLA